MRVQNPTIISYIKSKNDRTNIKPLILVPTVVVICGKQIMSGGTSIFGGNQSLLSTRIPTTNKWLELTLTRLVLTAFREHFGWVFTLVGTRSVQLSIRSPSFQGSHMHSNQGPETISRCSPKCHERHEQLQQSVVHKYVVASTIDKTRIFDRCHRIEGIYLSAFIF